MKLYAISEDELRGLLYNAMAFEALTNGGVDNWEWYGESFADYLKYYKEGYNIPQDEEFYFEDAVDHAFQEFIKKLDSKERSEK